MHVDELSRILDSEDWANRSLIKFGYSDAVLARSNLDSICRSGMTLRQASLILSQIQSCKAEISDLDMALNNLEKFVSAARSPLSLAAMFERDPTAIPILMRIFSASQYLSDLLIRDTEAYDSLRLTEGQLYSREVMVNELVNTIRNASESLQAMQMLRRFKRRETLRIAFGDLIVEHRFDQVVEQISFLADAIIEAALFYSINQLQEKWGTPHCKDGNESSFVILALGKLGGLELNYSSDIDLIAVYENDGHTGLNRRSNLEFYQRVTRDTIKLINEVTSLGAAYRVDMRLRPEGSRGPVCCSANVFLQYYDLQGRNWERQAFIKARPVAGNLDFGNEILRKMEHWVYRPILNRVDIGEIKSLKRKIEHRTLVSGEERTNVKTGHGGIRDIEFTIQFLQLLHGGTATQVRTANTLDAIHQLSNSDFLSRQEADLLRQNYCWLRRLEHLLQIMFDLQTHTLPENESELSKIAIRMGYREYFGTSVLEQFRNDLEEVTDVNNRILHHLLHDAFETRAETEEDLEENAVDLILQSDLSDESAARILEQYGISPVKDSRRLIENLGRESTIFLSTSRCRHFLASIIKDLLEQISETPDPEATLVSLSLVADAIGGKGALWELFSFHPPSLQLFVRLCASSDYLATIVRRNPGMIDEVIDSLLLDRLPSIESLRLNLDDLLTGSRDPNRILHSFKNVHHLRVGIRDIVGRDSIRETHRSLSDIAEVCLEKVAEFEFEKCAAKYLNLAMPAARIHQRNGLVILAMGKLGGREPNYHSDLDVVFLYDSNEARNAWMGTSAQHFYSELAARITRAITESGPNGKLFDLDSRLRPTGKSGALAVSFHEFKRYFESGEGQLWERLALCKGRVVFGMPELRDLVSGLVEEVVVVKDWRDEMVTEIGQMRLKMQENCRPQNLKRGSGGTVDVEFIVQMLQLKHVGDHPEVRVPGTIEALDQLIKINAIDREQAIYLIESYQFLRAVESRLRLMNTSARHDMPEGDELKKLAYLLRMDSVDLLSRVNEYRARNRAEFNSLFGLEE